MTSLSFRSPNAFAELEAASPDGLVEAPFGIVKMTADSVVLAYNAWETAASGLRAGIVLGKRFFADVAPCTNNALVAARYEEGDALDAVVDYVFAWRLTPTKVRLRLLKQGPGSRYLLVEKR